LATTGSFRARYSLGVRIIALADAFDAMTSNRPYHMAMSAAQAVKEIQVHADTQFAPRSLTPFWKYRGIKLQRYLKKGKKPS